MKAQLIKLIEAAIKAPSGHNTQPWKFKVDSQSITILPDLARALPVVDPDNHALYISLGCALENLVIAATHQNLQPEIKLVPDEAGHTNIEVNFESCHEVQKDELFHQIGCRQCTKNRYSGKPIPIEHLQQLYRSVNQEGIKLLFYTDRASMDDLTPFILEGSTRQFKYKPFVEELVHWIRFSKTEALQWRDGVWGASMGMPGVGQGVGKFIMKNLVNAKSEAKRWRGLVESSAALALFVAAQNDVEHWIRLGRAFQRFGLTATQLNISHAHMNMPCEEAGVRLEMARHLNLANQHLLLLLRLGYSNKMPYSFRRSMNDVII